MPSPENKIGDGLMSWYYRPQGTRPPEGAHQAAITDVHKKTPWRRSCALRVSGYQSRSQMCCDSTRVELKSLACKWDGTD